MNARRLAPLAVLAAVVLVTAGCEHPPIDSVQRGYRGEALGLVSNPRIAAAVAAVNQPPVVSSPEPGTGPDAGPPATAVYKNIQVLNDLNVSQFGRLMVSITEWIAPPDQACAYCHTPGEDLSSDNNYRKVVARQMLKMVRHINTDWKAHVASSGNAGAGVTCYTCHRGKAVPAYVWYKDSSPASNLSFAGNRAGQNAPSALVGVTSLPNDPLTKYLGATPTNIRVVARDALPSGAVGSIGSMQQTEATYGLMVHISKALGVNCTYCHNSRTFTAWSSSAPQRATAWYGIRMVRDANNNYLTPLTDVFPANRKGPLGDVAKVDCETCHQGVYKPMYGAPLLKDFPELAGPAAAPAPAAEGAAPVAN
jgi:photosynthetic reaction center cytochrome c subunit